MAEGVASARNGKGMSRDVKGRFTEIVPFFVSSSSFCSSFSLFTLSDRVSGIPVDTDPHPSIPVGLDYQSSSTLWQAVKTNNSILIILRPTVLRHN